MCVMFNQRRATSAILMRMMKMGGGQQLARSRYLLRESSGSIHLETDCWNFSQHPTFLSPSGRSAPLRNGLPSRSTGNGSCCSRSMSSITAPVLHMSDGWQHLDMIYTACVSHQSFFFIMVMVAITFYLVILHIVILIWLYCINVIKYLDFSGISFAGVAKNKHSCLIILSINIIQRDTSLFCPIPTA